MRLQWGAIPHTPGFDPHADDRWQALSEPTLEKFQRQAMILAVFCGILLVSMWALAWKSAGMDVAPRQMLWVMPWILVGFPLLIVAHELVHALAHPGMGMRSESVLGGIPRQGLFYAMYLGEMSRERLLAILLMPLLVLTLAPWLACVTSGRFSPFWAGISILNGVSACGDVLAMGLLLRGCPRGAVVRNQGWATYWRLWSLPGRS